MMKRVVGSVVLVVLTVLSAARAQDAAPWANKLFAVNGKIETVHDFGTVPRGALLQHQFSLTNIYAVPLNILRAWTSCGCVEVKPGTQTVNPLGKGSVDIVMDTRRFAGPKTVTIYVTFGNLVNNQQFVSTAILTVIGNCRTDVAVNPGVVVFGVVPRGQAPTQTVDVEYAGAYAWKITSMIKNDLLDVKVQEMPRQPGRVGFRLTLSPKPDAAAGSYKQELILVTNDAAGGTVPVPFDLTIQDPLTVFPNPVNFRTVKAGSQGTVNISVRGSGKPFKITGIDGLGDGLSVAETLPTDAKEVHILTVKCAVAQPGPVQKKLQIKTDLGLGATATVPVEATVVQ